MREFTIGEAAGAINVGLLFLQITLPLLEVLVLVCFLPSENTASTCSVISQFLQRTIWPTILSCDTAAERKQGVSGLVVTLKYLSLAAVVVTATAGVLAPIGLGEIIIQGDTVNATFAYASDPSEFGEGTPSRLYYANSRVCGNGFIPCPGVSPSDVVLSTDPVQSTMYDIFVAENITTCFGSGTNETGDLRSSPFQIQFRQYYTVPATNQTKNHTQSKLNTTGLFTLLENVFMENDFAVREGVIIDSKKGGLGFRNHTVPIKPDLKHGATWTERLLWIEPETICVDTNWTIEFGSQLSPFATDPQVDWNDLTLVNRGPSHGNMNYTPIPSFVNIEHKVDLHLSSRTFITAQNFGVYLKTLLIQRLAPNHTIGPRFKLDAELDYPFYEAFGGLGDTTSGVQLGIISDPIDETETQATDMPEIVTLDPDQFNLAAFNITRFDEYINTLAILQYPEQDPWYSPQSFSTILDACQSSQGQNFSSIDVPFVRCGYLIPPRKAKEGKRGPGLNGRGFVQDIHVCASGIRAVMKDTTFRYIPTMSIPSLAGLEILSVEPTTYSTESEFPTWGVENPGSHWNKSEIQLIWGIVDGNRFSASNDIRTIRSNHLYLPDFTGDSSSGTDFGDSMAASRGPGEALTSVYNLGSGLLSGFDVYFGQGNRRTLQKWLNASSSASTMVQIPNLIWTNQISNMLVGTKSLLDSIPSQTYPVRIYHRKITYDFRYGIPALVSWTIWFMAALIALGRLFDKHAREKLRLASLKGLINHLTIGRALVENEHPGICPIDASTKEWMAKAGGVMIDLSRSKGLLRNQSSDIEDDESD